MDPCLQEMITWFCKVSQIMNTGLVGSKKPCELISSGAVKRAQYFFKDNVSKVCRV
jgi:hypothetical protein